MAKALAERLNGAGLSVWWDRDRLEAGHNFAAEILEAIIRQHHFLFLLSRNSASSKWCRRELAVADELGRAVVPLKLEDVGPDQTPLQLGELHYIDLQHGVAAAWPPLARALGLGLGPPYNPENDPFARDTRLVDAIIKGLKYGKTFDGSLNLVNLLSDLGQSCCETERARRLFAAMVDFRNYSGGQINYDKVCAYLKQTWSAG